MLAIINGGIYMKCGELVACDVSKFINMFSVRPGSENVNYLSFQQVEECLTAIIILFKQH